MKPLPIVPDLDELEQGAVGPRPGFEGCLVDQFLFQCCKEGFRWCVVPAVSLSAHAARRAGFFQFLAVVMAGILTSPITVVNQSPRWPTVLQSGPERVENQTSVKGCSRRPTQNPSCAQIHDDGQVQPPLSRPDICDVSTARDIGPFYRKIPIQDILRHWMRMIGIRRDRNLRACMARRPFTRIIRATRFSLQTTPFFRSYWKTRGLP